MVKRPEFKSQHPCPEAHSNISCNISSRGSDAFCPIGVSLGTALMCVCVCVCVCFRGCLEGAISWLYFTIPRGQAWGTSRLTSHLLITWPAISAKATCVLLFSTAFLGSSAPIPPLVATACLPLRPRLLFPQPDSLECWLAIPPTPIRPRYILAQVAA